MNLQTILETLAKQPPGATLDLPDPFTGKPLLRVSLIPEDEPPIGPEPLKGPPEIDRRFEIDGRKWTILEITKETILCVDDEGIKNRWTNNWPLTGATEIEGK